MNKEELRYEAMEQEQAEDDHYEAHKREFLVKFKGAVYVEALTPEEAEEKAKDKPNLEEWVDEWEAEE